MALQYVYVARKDVARGIDTYSSKSTLPDGFAEDLQNVDTNASGKLTTRKGYQGHYGWVPMRVAQAEHDGTTIRLYFADSQAISLDVTKLGPLVVYGHLSGLVTGDPPAGDFTTADACKYYHTFSIASKVTLSAGSDTVTRTAAQHGYEVPNLWVGLAESTGSDTSNALVIPDLTTINRTTYAAAINYTVGTSKSAFVFYKDATAVAGSTHVYSATQDTFTLVSSGGGAGDLLEATGHTFEDGIIVEFTTTDTLPSSVSAGTFYYVTSAATNTFKITSTLGGSAISMGASWSGTVTVHRRGYTIPAATHNLNNFNIITKCWNTAATPSEEVMPRSVSISATGQVFVEFESAFTGVIQLASADNDSVKTATVAGPTSASLTIEAPGSPFVFPAIYVYDTSVSRYYSVAVDSWSYSEDDDEVTVSYTLTAASTEQVTMYWVTGQTTANAIELTDSGAVSESWVDTSPQLTVWGIDHAGTYRVATNPGGHVTWLDTYRKGTEARVVCGLGGNGFSAQTYAEVGSDYKLGSAYTSLRARTSAAVVIAPAFTDSANSRTRGEAVDASVVSNYAVCTAATYVSSGVVDYTLTWTSKTGAIADGGLLDVNLDYLTVAELGPSVHTGEWKITSVQSDSSTETVLRCANSGVVDNTTDVTGATGKAGIFTDKLTSSDTVNWIAGDEIIVPNITEDFDWIVKAVDAQTNPAARYIYFTGVSEATTMTSGILMTVSRTSDIVPLRTATLTVNADNFVRGDMLSVTGLDRRVRVLQANPQATQTCTITGDGTTATLTVGSAHGLNAGDKVILYGNVDIAGAFTVVDAPTTTTFTVASAETSGSVYLQGCCVQVDESLTIQDGDSADQWQVEGRWIPMEVPTSAQDLVQDTQTRHFDAQDYDAQNHMRSTLLNDALYLTNGDDEVYKWDGYFLYRAGMPKWQPGLFAQVDDTSSAILSFGLKGTFSAADSNGTITTTTSGLRPGDRLYNENQAQYATLTDVQYDDTTTTYTLVVRPEDDITAWAGSDVWYRVSRYKYYVKLTMVDANGYAQSTAAFQSEDLVVDYSQPGAIQLRLLPPPAFGAYDYDRIEVEVYRTQANGALYYLVARQLVDFDQADCYITITDDLPDSALNESRKDTITGALVQPPELGTGWEAPPRAKLITTLSNRAVYGNIKGWPEATIAIKPAANAALLAASSLAGKIFTFRKDATNTGTTTNMSAVARYEFLTAASISFTFDSTNDVDDSLGVETITETAHGMLTGQQVRVSVVSGALPTGLVINTTYYVIRVDANTFKLAATAADAMAGTAIGLTDAVGVTQVTGYSGVGIDPTAITATATTFVITSNGHGLSAGDWVYLYHASQSNDDDLRFAGWWQITSVTTNTFTVTYNNAGTAGTSADVDTWMAATTSTDIPVVLDTDYNWQQRDGNPVAATNVELQAAVRLAAAINASQRVTTTANFTPWLCAYAGADYPAGHLIVRSPLHLTTTPEVKVPASVSGYQVFVNDRLKAANDETSLTAPTFPSRLVLSYQNYPEIVDSPYVSDQSFSDSVIDINPADGQELIAIIPFFGESATGSGSQLSQNLLVFKTNSVYLVDVETRVVTKLATNGQGCSASRSVANTLDGVMFANESGVYRIGRDMRAQPVGLALSGYWRNTVNRAQIAQAYGHHYHQGRRYKLAVPTGASAFNDRAVVYDYDREGQQQQYGAWTTYTNHPVVGWCNLEDDAFLASTAGDVWKVRNLNEASDYRDDGAAVAEQVITLKSEDFDLPGTRKAVASVAVTIELETTDITGLQVYTATDMATTYTSAGAVTLDSSEFRHHTFRVTPQKRRGTNMQLKLTHATKDEGLTLTGVQYSVAQLSGKLVPDAEDH